MTASRCPDGDPRCVKPLHHDGPHDPELTDPQDEGSPDRLYLGIDGTMGDAQDVDHPFLSSVHGDYCRVCGLAESYRRHHPAAWIVTAGSLRVGGPYDDRDDAEGFAAIWNHAYPPPEHIEFVVEQITAEEAKDLDRRNA